MATKLFTKTTELVQPAWTSAWQLVDGIYVDGRFFEENIPILGVTLLLRVKPTKHFRQRNITFGARTFLNGIVDAVMYSNMWSWLEDQEWIKEIDFGSAFYGPGLNPFSWVCNVDLPTNAEVIYAIDYELEVRY